MSTHRVRSAFARFGIVVAVGLGGCGGGGVGPSSGFIAGATSAPALASVAPEPPLPAGVTPVPALSPTPMRIAGTVFPTVAVAASVTIRLSAAAPIFADGTATSIDVAATAATATTVDFVSPLAVLAGIDSASVDLTLAFPDGAVGTLPAAFDYWAPALAVVSSVPAGLSGASGIANANLDATGGRPLHLFARGGGDPFVLSPAPGRTFGPLPVPPVGTVAGVVDVEFRTPGLALWPGNAEFGLVPGTLVSDGTSWLVRGTNPGLLDALPAASAVAVDATVSLTFEDGTRQTLPAGGSAPGATLLRTAERIFTVVAGTARSIGQDPGVDGVTTPVDGAPAGAGPMALDAARNRLYVANGSTIEVFDTAQTMGPAPTPAFGPARLALGALSPATLTLPGGSLTGLAVSARDGRLWASNDLGVQVVDPLLPGAAVVTLTLPAALGATTHARRVLCDNTSGEMVVALFDGPGPGTEALLVYDTAQAVLTSVWRVGAMPSFRGTIANNATALGTSIHQVFNDGSPNGNTGQQVLQNVLSSNLPAATGALWNGELALRPAAGASGRVFLLYDNTGSNQGTVVAANACNAAVNGVPVGLASGVSISIPSDWVNTLDLTTGANSAGDGMVAGAWPLGAGALLGTADGQRGAVAYDASRDVVLVHAAATGGPAGFSYVNVASALVGPPPSGPPYSGFVVNGAVLAATVANATAVGVTLNTPSAFNPAVVPAQDQIRYLSAPGAIYQLSGSNNAATAYFTPPFSLLANVVSGPARGTPQLTALAIVVDSTAGSADGNAFVLGAPAAGDLTEVRFANPGLTLTTSAGVGPVAAGPGMPVLVATNP